MVALTWPLVFQLIDFWLESRGEHLGVKSKYFPTSSWICEALCESLRPRKLRHVAETYKELIPQRSCKGIMWSSTVCRDSFRTTNDKWLIAPSQLCRCLLFWLERFEVKRGRAIRCLTGTLSDTISNTTFATQRNRSRNFYIYESARCVIDRCGV